MLNIAFDFYGTQIRVHVPTVEDVLHLCDYYRDYRIPNRLCIAPMFEVRLAIDGDGSFVAALLNQGVTKSIWLRRNKGAWELYERYSTHPSKATPIPPLLLRKDLSFSLKHASAFGVVEPGGETRAVVVCGDSGSGKSTIALHAMKAGAYFISDDMAWFCSGLIYPFTRPIGVRSGLARSLGSDMLIRCQRHGLRLETNGELTYMVHPRDLGLPVLDAPVRPVVTVQLVRSDRTALIQDPALPDRLLLTWNPRGDADRGWEELAEALNARGVTL